LINIAIEMKSTQILSSWHFQQNTYNIYSSEMMTKSFSCVHKNKLSYKFQFYLKAQLESVLL